MMRISYIFFLMIFSMSCIEPFEFETGQTKASIIIEASITDETKAHEITISYAVSLDSPPLDEFAQDTTVAAPAEGATVWLEDQRGQMTMFAESKPGRYLSDANFSAAQGDTYTLNIDLSNGDSYVSDAETLMPKASLGKIYSKVVELPSTQNSTTNKGSQLFVDANVLTGFEGWFRYEWEDVYEFETPEISRYETDADGVTIERINPINVCYRLAKSTSPILATTQGRTEAIISELPIRFLDKKVVLPMTKYFIRLRQYSINSDAYQYFKELRENNVGSGSFFDKQKGTSFGNIHSVTNPDEIVLGYFELASVEEQSLFFTPSELGTNFSSYPATCVITRTPDGGRWLISDLDKSQPIIAKIYVNAQCADCRFFGTLDKPDFWED